MKNPLSETTQQWFYVKVLQKQTKPDLETEKVSDGMVQAGV